MYNSKIIADSLSPQGDRLTTFVIQFPRIVLAEAKTHRVISGLGEQIEVTQSFGLNDEFDFSRNSASSRAIPSSKMIKMVEENPFIPVAWQKSHKGMQGTKYFTKDSDIKLEREEYLKDRDYVVESAKRRLKRGVSKQLINRQLEPFMWHKVIVTSSEEGLQNFFNLRCPQYEWDDCVYKSKKEVIKHGDITLAPPYEDNGFQGEYENLPKNDLEWLSINKSQADIHIQAIAELMWDSYNESKPKQLEAGEWHIPFGDNIDDDIVLQELVNYGEITHLGSAFEIYEYYAVKIATARCARISYNNFEGKDDYEADIKLYDRLSNMEHWSPFEHCAKAMSDGEYEMWVRGKATHKNSRDTPIHNNENKGWCRNFKGFIQLREKLD